MNLKKGLHEYNISLNGKSIKFLFDLKSRSDDLVVFIHGLASSWDSFRNVFDKPYFPGSSLMLMDLVGFGKSSKPEDFSYSMEDQALLCIQLFKALPRSNLHIVAHSMGVAVALLFFPELSGTIRSFVNIEGNLIAEDCGMLSRRIADSSFEEYESRIFEEQKHKYSDCEMLRYGETTPVAVHRSARSLVEWSDSGKLLNIFKKLPCRKCYFWGEENSQMPVLRKLRKVKKIMVHGSGHTMMTDNPEEFYAKLEEFIFPPP